MWRTLSVCSVLVLCAADGQAQTPAAGSPPPRNAPVCQVDPSWPHVPENWILVPWLASPQIPKTTCGSFTGAQASR
jgi:hypothetical protein